MDGNRKNKVEDVPEQHLKLMEIYLSEWIHRDSFLWTQTVHFFYATLIVIIFPNAAQRLGVVFPSFSPVIFPVVGFIMAITFLIISLGLARRLAAIGDTYQALIDMLPEEYRRKHDGDLKIAEIHKTHLSVAINLVLFGGLAVLAIVIAKCNL